MSDLSCPALPELFTEPRDEALQAHVDGCPRCRTLLAVSPPATLEIGPEQAKAAEAIVAPLPPRTGADLDFDTTAGKIAIFSADDADFHLLGLVLDRDGPAISIAPIDERVAMATEWDLLLAPDVLGYRAMAAIWDARAIRIEQLVEIRAEVPEQQRDWAQRLLALANQEGEVPAGAPVGVGVLGDLDPRLSYRDSRAELRRPFWLAAELLGADRSFGAVVRRRREELGLDSSELADLVEEKGWLGRLESGQLDINARLPVTAAVGLLRSLQIRPFTAMMEMLRAAIEATTEDAPQTALLARRRTGSRQRHVAANHDEARRRADVYVGRVVEEFHRR